MGGLAFSMKADEADEQAAKGGGWEGGWKSGGEEGNKDNQTRPDNIAVVLPPLLL